MELKVTDLFKFLYSEDWETEEYPYDSIAFKIKENYYFECEVSVQLADWIYNLGFGCDRPNEIDSDEPNFEPNGREIIRVYADSYIDSNFKEDFLSSFYDEDFFIESNYSKVHQQQLHKRSKNRRELPTLFFLSKKKKNFVLCYYYYYLCN